MTQNTVICSVGTHREPLNIYVFCIIFTLPQCPAVSVTVHLEVSSHELGWPRAIVH